MTFLPELTKEEILQMLEKERVCRIGLNDEPQPFVVPIEFAYVDGAIYVHTSGKGLKARLARLNPYVCVELDRYNETVQDFRSVIVRGRMTEVSDPEERKKFRNSLARKAVGADFTRIHDKSREQLASMVTVFKIEITDMTGVKSHGNGH